MLGAGPLRRPRGTVQGGRRDGGSGWGTCVYLWQIHVDVWHDSVHYKRMLANSLLDRDSFEAGVSNEDAFGPHS